MCLFIINFAIPKIKWTENKYNLTWRTIQEILNFSFKFLMATLGKSL